MNGPALVRMRTGTVDRSILASPVFYNYDLIELRF